MMKWMHIWPKLCWIQPAEHQRTSKPALLTSQCKLPVFEPNSEWAKIISLSPLKSISFSLRSIHTMVCASFQWRLESSFSSTATLVQIKTIEPRCVFITRRVSPDGNGENLRCVFSRRDPVLDAAVFTAARVRRGKSGEWKQTRRFWEWWKSRFPWSCFSFHSPWIEEVRFARATSGRDVQMLSKAEKPQSSSKLRRTSATSPPNILKQTSMSTLVLFSLCFSYRTQTRLSLDHRVHVQRLRWCNPQPVIDSHPRPASVLCRTASPQPAPD